MAELTKLKDLGIVGTELSGSFAFDSPSPIDLREVVDTLDTLEGLKTVNNVYPGMTVFVKAEGKHYKYDENTTNWKPLTSIEEVSQDDETIVFFAGGTADDIVTTSILKDEPGRRMKIIDVLNSESLLPEPASINDLSYAYLVGTTPPYNLYIQVGSTSEDAVWKDMGPFNAASRITVNGQYQSDWNADTKADVSYVDDKVAAISSTGGSGNCNIPAGKIVNGTDYVKVYAKDDLSDQAWKIFTPGSLKLTSSDWGYTVDWTPSQIIHSVLQANGGSLTKIFEFPRASGTLATTEDVEIAVNEAVSTTPSNGSDIHFLRQEIPAGGEVTLLPNSLYMISVSGNNVCLKDSSDLTGKGQFLIVFCADIGTAGPNKFAVMGMVYSGGFSIDTFTVVATNGVTKLKNYNSSSTAGYNVMVKAHSI